MTPSELKRNYEANHPNGRFFSRENMKFSGDTMKNFGCFKSGDFYILYRKKPTPKGFNGGFKFDCKTFKYEGLLYYKD